MSRWRVVKEGKSLSWMEVEVSLGSTILALGPMRQRVVYAEVTSSRKTLLSVGRWCCIQEKDLICWMEGPMSM